MALLSIPFKNFPSFITDTEIPLTSEDLLKLGEHHHEASDSIVTSGKGTKNIRMTHISELGY